MVKRKAWAGLAASGGLATVLVMPVATRDGPLARTDRQAPCAVEAFDTVLYAADGVNRIGLDAGPGNVRIEGRAGTDRVRVYARRCASSREVLERLWFDVDREGDEVRLKVQVPTELFSPTTGTIAAVDLQVEVPPRFAVDARTGQGAMDVSGVGAVAAQAGLGDVRVARVAGDVIVQAGPGDARIRDIGGNVRVALSVGEIDVQDVAGTVSVGASHVGPALLRNIRGTVTIEDAHTGDITAHDVGGDLVIGTMRRGNVEYLRINGRVVRKDQPQR